MDAALDKMEEAADQISDDEVAAEFSEMEKMVEPETMDVADADLDAALDKMEEAADQISDDEVEAELNEIEEGVAARKPLFKQIIETYEAKKNDTTTHAQKIQTKLQSNRDGGSRQ